MSCGTIPHIFLGMKQVLRFWVHADPKGCPRRTVYMQRRPGATIGDCHRHSCHSLVHKRGKDDKGFRAAVKYSARRVTSPLESCFGRKPVFVGIVYFLQRPKSHYSRGNRALHLLPSAPSPWNCTVKPDSDNVEKSVWDALKGIAWDDDAQVNTNVTVKRWASSPSQVGALVVVSEVAGQGLAEFSALLTEDPRVSDLVQHRES